MNKLKINLLFLTLLVLLGCSETPSRMAVSDHVEDREDGGDIAALPAPGVPLQLARQRANSYSNVQYAIDLEVPESAQDALTGQVSVSLDIADASQPLVLDFRAPADNVLGVTFDGAEVDYSVPQDHILIPANRLGTGQHEVAVRFRSTDAALNRQADFLYALFVPDRASTAIPVFEQPDIKAQFSLTLTIPSQWQAVANGELLSRESSANGQDILRFAETRPISTYLFSFAVGDLQTETAERGGRSFTMYHRETDVEKLERNRDAIFDLHATALEWLEEYTGIPYPFDKFDFFAVPAFQFGGMEHPGAIWYRASSLFLDPTASRTQELGRASLIAHETAHMWFGDLVTMEWFNDVWMKEVFANFLAAKIAGPAFPDLNLPLRFFQAHHPRAYGVDRTAGSNPIRQNLDNLSDAGSLYGAIIYQKAPVVVQQLEQLIGENRLRSGLALYLQQFPYGNATWTDLVTTLDTLSSADLVSWSEVWVNETGRPQITTEWGDGGVTLRQEDLDSKRGLLWNQPVMLAVSVDGVLTQYRVSLEGSEAFVSIDGAGDAEPDFIFAGADGIGYGRFVLDERSRLALLTAIHELEDPIHRAVVWQTLWEEVLDGELAAMQFIGAAITAIGQESDELVSQQVLGLLRHAYWQFLTQEQRQQIVEALESSLWQALDLAPTAGRKGAYFSAIVDVSQTQAGVARLERIWRQEEVVEGLPLQERQYTNLAEALALRNVANASSILDAQEARISNPDRLSRFQFIRPALSTNIEEREQLFRSFADVTVRRRESWILNAQSAIHHPIRNEQSISMLRRSLDLTEEIQRTGDIFFPLSWLNATLAGYQSDAAADIVTEYLDANPELPPRLRGKVLQAVDDLYRVVALSQ